MPFTKLMALCYQSTACCLVATTMVSQSLAKPANQSKSGHAQASASRKTTDVPVMSKGKLGQELFLAVDHRDLAGVKLLLKRGADPNSRNGLEFTPLYMAGASHQMDTMKALIAAGAKVNAPSSYGTALTFAALGGNIPGMHLLLSHGAKPNPTRGDGITVLMLTARAGDPKTLKELIDRKVPVNTKNNFGSTALTYAAREGNLDAGQVLIDAGANVDTTDSLKQTALFYAAMNGHPDFVKILLQSGAKVDAKDIQGRTALLVSANYGDYPEVTKALITAGADTKATDKSGRTASMLAAIRGHKASLSILGEPAEAPTDTLRSPTEAVKTSLHLIETSMRTFTKRTGCISCHQEGLGRIVSASALTHGFSMDPSVDQAQVARINGGLAALKPLHLMALKDVHAMNQVPLIEIEEVATGDSWILAGMAAHKQPATAENGAMAMVLARQQQPDGHWSFSVPRVPMQSSFFTFTALAIKSLQAYTPKSYAAERASRIKRAKSWMLKAQPATSEDRASCLLGLSWAGASVDELQKTKDAIIADQRDDGGWSQIPTLQSDAYATGQALYALHLGGLPATDPIYVNGVQFLLRTQDEDGSWFVNKRALPANNYFNASFPHGESQYSSFNGTCWAALALMETLPTKATTSVSR